MALEAHHGYTPLQRGRTREDFVENRCKSNLGGVAAMMVSVDGEPSRANVMFYLVQYASAICLWMSSIFLRARGVSDIARKQIGIRRRPLGGGEWRGGGYDKICSARGTVNNELLRLKQKA